ncbi:hypothetical protein BC629DRAFT_1597304 [Irpex lacteus]|nr:hypothetical protein BC629DRAFT_1597304 [Irpex lacteus]
MATFASSKKYPSYSLQLALAKSIAEGTLADTAFRLYSRRQQNWKVGEQRVVYGSSVVLKHLGPTVSRYFTPEFSAAGQENGGDTDDYDYLSDSDLDEYEAIKEPDEPESEAESADTDPEAYKDAQETESSQSFKLEEDVPTEIDEAFRMEDKESKCKYRIMIPDIAANTWQAFVYFIYTGHIHFAPLESEGKDFRRAEQAKHKEKNPSLPPLCSPKSIYRVAHHFDIAELKELARKDLMSKVTPKTVAKEIFSKFSSMYEDILHAQLQFLYTGDAMATALPDLLKIVKRITTMGMLHTDKALMIKLSTLLNGAPARTIGSSNAPSASVPAATRDHDQLSDGKTADTVLQKGLVATTALSIAYTKLESMSEQTEMVSGISCTAGGE